MTNNRRLRFSSGKPLDEFDVRILDALDADYIRLSYGYERTKTSSKVITYKIFSKHVPGLDLGQLRLISDDEQTILSVVRPEYPQTHPHELHEAITGESIYPGLDQFGIEVEPKLELIEEDGQRAYILKDESYELQVTMQNEFIRVLFSELDSLYEEYASEGMSHSSR